MRIQIFEVDKCTAIFFLPSVTGHHSTSLTRLPNPSKEILIHFPVQNILFWQKILPIKPGEEF
jgi:hypothetical protein